MTLEPMVEKMSDNVMGEEAGRNGFGASKVKEVENSFLEALSCVLTHLASPLQCPMRLTRFHSVRAPKLSIRQYLDRIAKHSCCSNECFVLCVLYIDRIVKRDPNFPICDLNIHRLLMTGIVVAAKFIDDVHYSNDYYGKVGGVKTKELNILEMEFLQLINWKLHASPQEFDHYHKHVQRASRGRAVLENQPALVMDANVN